MIAGNAHPTDRSVLIVDDSEDSRDVLRTLLERRGVRIYEASEARQGLAIAAEHHPEVIVLDLEADAADQPDVRDGYAAGSARMVMLGNARRCPVANGQYVAKPYHYGPLIRTIETLLQAESACDLKNAS